MKLAGVFSRISPGRILIIGDLVLDAYTVGKIKRISPEAPVGVVHVSSEEHRPGGAGNVALNLLSMGAEVVVIGRVGEDSPGALLKAALEADEADIRGIKIQPGFPTPLKNRIIADNQQIVRVDHEKVVPLSAELEAEFIKQIPILLKGVNAVAISDYGKGLLTPKLIQCIITNAKQSNIPVIADPKGLDFTKYSGVTLLKPNTREAYKAANLPLEAPLQDVAKRILEQSQAEVLMITRSEEGISLFFKNGNREDFPPEKAREVKDVTGAGDTVLAMVACALASGLEFGEAAQLANVAAGIAIERFGCARISLSELAQRLLETDSTNKLFDEDHLFALKQILQDESFCVIGIHEDPGLTPQLFAAIQKIRNKNRVLIYLRDEKPSDPFVNLLASLRDIDFIVLKHDSLNNLCRMIQPDAVYVAEKGGVVPIDNIHNLIAK